MFDKRCCRLVWGLVFGIVGVATLWRLSRIPEVASLVPYYLPILPSNVTRISEPYTLRDLVHNDASKLVDLTEFSFLNNAGCNSTPPILAAVVHSAPANFHHRRAIRSTWGTSFHVVFMIGETNSSIIQNEIEDEIKEFNDIVQGTFVDSYRNMTYKHVMSLKWAAYHCPNAKYVLKTDDDVFVNAPKLQEFINLKLSPLGARKLLLCNVIPRSIVKRGYRNKWRVTPSEYPGRWFPRYCAGWAVVYSPDVAFELYAEAQRSPYFWIDDIHITGTLAAKRNITQTDVSRFTIDEATTEDLVSSRKSQNDFLFSLSSPKNFKYLWLMVNR